MNRASVLSALSLLVLNALGLGTAAPAPASVVVPREKISLSCPDAYFKTARQNFLLVDESYPRCVLRVPLALGQRWPGARTFYFIPRVSASLHAKDGRGQGRWLPLSPLVNLGADPLHRAVSSAEYEAVELSGRLGNLKAAAGSLTPDTVGAGGKLTVCVAPVLRGETPCTTFDLTARYRVYLR